MKVDLGGYVLGTNFFEWDFIEDFNKHLKASKPLYLLDRFGELYIAELDIYAFENAFCSEVLLIDALDDSFGWFFCRKDFPSLEVAKLQTLEEIKKLALVLTEIADKELLHEAVCNGLRWI